MLVEGHPTIVFLTVCAARPASWLASEEAQQSLVSAWQNADAWLVGSYVLMPDHLHLFCAPRDLQFTIEKWIAYWKSQFSRGHTHSDWIWQRSAFHRRMRSQDEY